MLPSPCMATTNKPAARGLILLAVLLLGLAGCTPPGPRALLKGRELLEKGDYVHALAELTTATTLLPTNAHAWNYLGLAYHHAGQPDEAQKAYQRALRLDKDLVAARFNLGCLWLEQNKLEWAKAELAAYTMLQPRSADGFVKLGTAQWRLREAAAAEKSFQEALRLRPNDAEAITGVGLARLQRGRVAEASQFFTEALRRDPAYAPARLNLAVIAHEHLKDKALALQHYRAYASLRPPPDNVEAIKAIISRLEHEMVPLTPPPAASPTPAATAAAPPKPPATAAPPAILAVAKPPAPATPPATTAPATSKPPPQPTPRAEPPPKAQPRPVAAKPTPPTSAPPPVVKAPVTETVLLAPEPVIRPGSDVSPPPAAQPAPSRKAETAVAAAPSAVSTSGVAKPAPKKNVLQRLNPLKLLTRDRKQPAPASSTPTPESLPAAVTATPGPSANRTSLKASSPTPASRRFARYPYKNPPRPSPGDRAEAERAFAQGVQAQQANRLPEAIQAYRRAIQLDGTFFDACYNLGLAATQAGNHSLALYAYEQALAARPESLDARYNLALVLRQTGYPLDAVEELERVLAKYPNESRAHVTLGNIYAQQLDDPARARQHYLKALEADPRNPQAGAIRYWLADHPQ